MHHKELASQKEILAQTIKAQENERQRIAGELHDAVVSKLSLISLWLQHPDAAEPEQINEELQKLIDNTRNLSHTLYPYQLSKFGLVKSLEEYVLFVNRSIKCTFNTNISGTPFDPNTALAIYRIAMEFTNNSIKYSGTDQIQIELNLENDQGILSCKDYGKGIDFNIFEKGMGMNNIEVRAKSINAQVKWESQPGAGVLLTLNFTI